MSILTHYSPLVLILALLLFLCLMLAAFALWKIAHSDTRDLAIDLKQKPDADGKKSTSNSFTQQRRQQRIPVDGLQADISNGFTSYGGMVTNISPRGLCLKDVPDNFSASHSLLSVAIRGRNDNYRLIARTRWVHRQRNHGQTIGAEIASSTPDWPEFFLSQLVKT